MSLLGHAVARRPRTIVALWTIVIALGGWGAARFPAAALGGSAELEGTGSQQVAEALRREFRNPFVDPLIVAVSTPHVSVGEARLDAWLETAATRLAALPDVSRIASPVEPSHPELRSPDGHAAMLVVGLASGEAAARQRAIPVVRGALAPLAPTLAALDPNGRFAVTGGAAVTFDINDWSGKAGDRAEKRALPLTLAVLVLAFGTLVAASLPFITGLAATVVSLGLAYLLALVLPVSNLLGNVVTMIGLAVGIDYALLMVSHYREHGPDASVAEAVAATVAKSGLTIVWSGLTVTLGLLGLLFSPILETRCVGIGGALVVAVAVLAAITLLPAILVILGPWLERLPVLRHRARAAAASRAWQRHGEWIVRRPLPVLIATASCVLALALPCLAARIGVSNEPWFLPAGMESRVGNELLAALHDDNAGFPIDLVVRSPDDEPVVGAPHVPALLEFAARLRSDARIARVRTPVDMWPQIPAALEELYLSRDRRAALFELTPINGLPLAGIQALAREIGALPAGELRVAVGGPAAYFNDFDRFMGASLPKVFGFVLGTTLLLLFAAFRSYLLPVKAVLMNLLAVAAGLGAVVAVFQFGWGASLIGLEKPFATIPAEVPLMVFCLSFGLSMDYELFLLFRIQDEYLAHGDNDRSTVAGLATVAPVITGAGLIMAIVFGAFMLADIAVLKMIGVGLTVAVLVDATVVRALLVPAFMAVAGRWNWYPGRRPAGGAAGTAA